MSTIRPNMSQLDPFLHQLNRQNITLREDEVKEANLSLQEVLLGTMLHEMKRVDETFREVYRQPHYVGSYYENLRVGHPSEFDINLELQLPISELHVEIQTKGTEPGFAKIRVNTQFHIHTSAAVRRKIESWLEDGYLCRDRIIQWLQGIVDKALRTVNWPRNVTVRGNISGPAVTLNVRQNTKEFAVDLVPVFSFGTDRWPPQPTRQLRDLPVQISPYLKWCVVPKSPRQDSVSTCQWRMSFYMPEKEMMNNLNNMKPVIKLMKLLRDNQNWPNLSSYYIKTIFMWEQVTHGPGTTFWQHGLGYLFMHMLGKLEAYLQDENIPFFWDKRSNLISHLSCREIQNIRGRVTHLKRQLELALSQPDRDLPSVINMLFTSQTKTKVPEYRRNDEHSSTEAGDLQQAESTNWSAIMEGVAAGVGFVAAAVGAVVLASMVLSRNRNND